jgi:hypothetical protein
VPEEAAVQRLGGHGLTRWRVLRADGGAGEGLQEAMEDYTKIMGEYGKKERLVSLHE